MKKRLTQSIKNPDKIKYYTNISINLNLSTKELRERIKINEYARIGYK